MVIWGCGEGVNNEWRHTGTHSRVTCQCLSILCVWGRERESEREREREWVRGDVCSWLQINTDHWQPIWKTHKLHHFNRHAGIYTALYLKFTSIFNLFVLSVQRIHGLIHLNNCRLLRTTSHWAFTSGLRTAAV